MATRARARGAHLGGGTGEPGRHSDVAAINGLRGRRRVTQNSMETRTGRNARNKLPFVIVGGGG